MRTTILLKIISSALFCLLVSNTVQAQVFRHITHTSGTVTYGSTNVTVVPDSSSTSTTNDACISTGIHYFPRIAPTHARSYTYHLSVPTRHVIIKFFSAVSAAGFVFSFRANNQHYPLNSSHISSLPILGAGCNSCMDMILWPNGRIADTTASQNQANKAGCMQIDIREHNIQSFSVRLDSSFFSINDTSPFGVYFLEDTLSFIKQPFTDTVLCPGDKFPLVYTTSFPFNSGNVFTAQLSNASGSFSSPVSIGTKTATGADTVWCTIPANTITGAGYRVRLVSSNPQDTSLDNQVNIRIKAVPQAFSNSSNTPVCTGDNLQLIGSTSSSGVTWTWTGPNGFSSVAEDTVIANAAMNRAGDYVLTATLGSTGCSLKDTATVVMKQTPDKPNATSNSPVCATKTLALSSTTTTTGVSYSWAGPGSYSNGTQNPTVTANAASTHAGDYISTATLNGCSSKDTVSVLVLPKPNKPTAGAVNTSLCARQDLQLTATTVAGASYNWYGPAAYTSNIQNAIRTYIQMNHSGAYHVYATVNGCISDTDSVVVIVNTDPFVNIFPTPGIVICKDQQAIFTAIPTNGGTSPTYDWRINGISTGSTGVTYQTTTLNHGEVVSCHMTSTTTCSTPFTDTSNTILMAVLAKMTPAVSMSVNPTPPWNDNILVTFTATPTNGGNPPIYKWYRNGNLILGAINATWGVHVGQLSKNDEICVVLKSTYECPQPDTAKSNCINAQFTGVSDIVNSKNIKVYPNPAQNKLHIIVPGMKDFNAIITDITGRVVLLSALKEPENIIDVSALVTGVYIIKVSDNEHIYISKFVKE